MEIRAYEVPGYLEAVFGNCRYVSINTPKGSYNTSNVDVAILFPAEDLEDVAWSQGATSYSATISSISTQRKIEVECNNQEIRIYVHKLSGS